MATGTGKANRYGPGGSFLSGLPGAKSFVADRDALVEQAMNGGLSTCRTDRASASTPQT
jgi:hypothetical protein